MTYEGDGRPRRWLSAGSGLTAPHQAQGLVCDEVLSDGGYPEIPGIGGSLSCRGELENLPTMSSREMLGYWKQGEMAYALKRGTDGGASRSTPHWV